MSGTEAAASHKYLSTSSHGYSTLPEVSDMGSHFPEKEAAVMQEKQMIPNSVGMEVVGSQGLQHAEGQPGLEALGREDKETVETRAYYSNGEAEIEQNDSRVRGRRRRRTWVIALVALLIVLGVALGIGLGVGLQDQSEQSAESGSGTASNDTSTSLKLSTRGALSGTGITMRRQGQLTNLTTGEVGTSEKDNRNLLLVYQHYNGELRWMQREYPDMWSGGSESESITTWAKNGTPLSLMGTTTRNGSFEWHLFYIGKDNRLRQQTYNQDTRRWKIGLLTRLNIRALYEVKVGLASCYYGGPIADPSFSQADSDSGIRLWVATGKDTFQQLAWRPGMPGWVVEKQWTGLNGRAQPACNGFAPGAVTYTMFVDQDDKVAFYWRDHGSGDGNDLSHPTNEWVQASLSIPAVDPGTGLSYGYGGNLFARTSNAGPVLGWNITFDAENTSITGSSLDQVSGDQSIADSSLQSWSIPPDVSDGDGYEVLVFYQTDAEGIMMFSGDVETGEWTPTRLPIPDD